MYALLLLPLLFLLSQMTTSNSDQQKLFRVFSRFKNRSLLSSHVSSTNVDAIEDKNFKRNIILSLLKPTEAMKVDKTENEV